MQPPPPPPPEPKPQAVFPEIYLSGGLVRGEVPAGGLTLQADGLAIELDYRLRKRIYLSGSYTRAELTAEGATGGLERAGVAIRLLLPGTRGSGWGVTPWLEGGLGRQMLDVSTGQDLERNDLMLGAGLQLGKAPVADKQSWAIFAGARGLLSGGRDDAREKGWTATLGVRFGW
jgi:hypothetical protein